MQRTTIGSNIEISRLVTGLWQVADQERSGTKLDATRAATDLAAYASMGFDTFDMADHYGSAEEIIGRLVEMRAADPTIPAYRAFTKWCPEPGAMTPAVVRAAVERACRRMGTDRIDLLQFHWWMFEHPGLYRRYARSSRSSRTKA